MTQLGKRRLLLAIHDVSFPADPDEDLGRGSPATRAAGRLLDYARRLGFTGIQLGPQGQTARSNPSPYDGTIFSRNLGNIAAATFAAHGVDVAPYLVDGGPARHVHAYDAAHALVDAAYAARDRDALAAFRREHAAWLDADALHAALCATYGGAGFRDWPARDRDAWLSRDHGRVAELLGAHADRIDRYAFGQMLVHLDQARVRDRAGLALYGDLQIGYADADAWRWAAAFLPGYCMGAPPSRTNPEGQPWGYPVLDPTSPIGRALVRARAAKYFAEYASVRIDHPHGLVCPWVYRTGSDVAAGTRLFESPDDPELGRFAIARRDQLDPAKPRYADDYVRALDAAQIDRYAVLFDELVTSCRCPGDLSCEVLSTMPTPLACMLARYGLGRWRVIQKANLDDPTDVYRTEHAAPVDWVMLGNHDTAPIFSVIPSWSPAKREQWARHLAARLALPDPARLASDGFLATAMLAELFLCPAENVSIFFADLFGETARFNRPGVVDDANWTLRLSPDFERLHQDRLARGAALDLPLAVEIAAAARALNRT